MNEHKEEIYINGSDTIVVFIHGIVESPNQFRRLNKIAKKKGYSYFNMLLPGHGKTPKEFGQKGYKEWVLYVNEKLDELRLSFEKIIIVGHSMGCLLAINSYLYNKDKIVGFFFLAIPFNITLKFNIIFESLILFFKLDKVFNFKFKGISVKNVSMQVPNLFEFILWIPRYLELFYLSYKIKTKIKDINIPIVYIQSLKDGLVSVKSIKTIAKNCNNNSKILILKNSGHSIYSKKDRNIIFEQFEKFI